MGADGSVGTVVEEGLDMGLGVVLLAVMAAVFGEAAPIYVISTPHVNWRNCG